MLKTTNDSQRRKEINSLKKDLKNYRRFKKLADEKREEALLAEDKESYELWDDDYFYEMSQIYKIQKRIKELEGAE